MGKYKLLTEDTMKNLIDFLDEVQFDAATEGDTDSMHKVNFCNWAINELLNSPEARIKDLTDSKPKKPKKKSRDDYVDETFMDWNLPDMSDEDYEKLVDSFDGFLKGWEKEYNKKNPKKKAKKEPTFRPHIDDVSEYMSLKEIEEYLLDDPDLTTEEAFDLYYDEHKRVERAKERKKLKSLNQICKELGIQYPKDDEKN